MGEPRELVTAEQAGTALALLSALALVLAVIAGARWKGTRSPLAGQVALVAAASVLLFPLWLVYNAIMDWLGLDSVAGLAVNVILFALVGAGLGLALRRFWPAGPSENVPAHAGASEPGSTID
ncbi:MAG: hypothetical protein ACK47B_05635 [Armatimonadota bacterium]